MAQQQIAGETSEIVEQSELIPCGFAEQIFVDVSLAVGQEERYGPDGEEYALGAAAVFLYPCREERHVEIHSYEQIHVPHVVFGEAELQRYHGYVAQRVGQSLRLVALHVAEKVAYYLLWQSDDACEPGEYVVEHRPYEHRPENAQYTLFVEILYAHVAYREQQQTGHHHKKRHGRTQQRTVDGGPVFVFGQFAEDGRDVERINAMYADDHKHGYEAHDVEPHYVVSFVQVVHCFMGF